MATANVNDKWRKCAFCDRQFTKVEHLNRHQRSHTGERPFKCPKCDQRYARSDVLARHIQNHPRRVYRSKGTKQVPSPNANQQFTSISADDTQPEGDLLEARGSASPAGLNLDSDARVPARSSSSSSPPVDLNSQYMLTSNAGRPVQQWPQPPIESVNVMSELLFDPLWMQEPNEHHPPGTENHLAIDSSLYTNIPPLLDQPIGDSWPFSATLYAGCDLSHISMDVACIGANASLGSSAELLERQPSPFISEPPLLEVPMINENMPKAMSLPCVSPAPPDSLHRVQQLWSGRGSSQPALLIQTLWNDIAEHKADNILSDPGAHVNLPKTSPSDLRPENDMSDKITKPCRERLFAFCNQTQRSPEKIGAANVLPPSEPQPSEASSDPLTSMNHIDIYFPSVEILDLSLKFYFRHVQLSLPFVHQPTFNVSDTPCLLLLPMILIGYSILDPRGSVAFVSRFRTRLIELCRVDLAYKARGKSGSPSALIRSLGSSILVLYLNLDQRQNREEEAALMLCAQTLHIAEKHGLYETFKCQDLIAGLLAKFSDGERGWKVWARVESVKRLILSLMRMDAAYSRLMGTTGVIDPNQVNVVVPTISDLFDSPSADKFVENAKMTDVTMSVIHMRHLAKRPSGSEMINKFLLRVILDNTHILISNAQVKIFSAADHTVLQSTAFVPVNLYNQSAEAKNISRQLVAISKDCREMFRPPTGQLCSLTWNYLCIVITAPIEQIELALGRRGHQSALKARGAIKVWSKTPAARRAVLHAAQIFYILSNGAHLPLPSVDKTLLRVESMVFTAALVVGLYFLTDETSTPSSPMADKSIPINKLELLQEIDWAMIDDEGLTEQQSDWTMTLESAEQSPSSQCTATQARQFIRTGLFLLTFDSDSQIQGANTARRVFQEYAYLLDQLGGHDGSDSSIANLARSISNVLEP
ncbi:hypothetical protein EDB81DRAFT_952073 [Dactylonectria macrodidyma]|uniref:C2H2-type domain-containing protein n=1 Tax=Dactylonectria macrodidyma TaxID=307937 RepID=A0A9P9DPR3_9HYPO|nr:hypothetical protein EDB81DRAFT_952073 [Dactylonectria macrodidyma]